MGYTGYDPDDSVSSTVGEKYSRSISRKLTNGLPSTPDVVKLSTTKNCDIMTWEQPSWAVRPQDRIIQDSIRTEEGRQNCGADNRCDIAKIER